MLPTPRRLLASFSLACVFATSGARAELPADCPGLGAALVEHSCFHSTYGPFATRLATPGANVSSATQNLDPVHTEFRVGLVGSQSSVTYAPTRSGAFSIFLGARVPLSVRDESGTDVAELAVFDAGSDCQALPISHVFELEGGTRYQLLFGPTSSEHVVVVVEYVDDFLIENGRDADADGYGNPADVVVSSCVPPAGYVQNASDCDDLEPLVHPAAEERCGDDLDQNCNGLEDDTGLSCSMGVGACRAEGALACAEGTAQCSAVALESSFEICNGVDDDCNGAIDESPNLCPDEDRPTCVRDQLGAFCGCLLDLDCGPLDSGRTCDSTTRRCVDGCSSEPGRNGCPEGTVCDEGRPPRGACRPEKAAEDAGAAGADGGPELPTLPGAGGEAGEPSNESSERLTSTEGCSCRTVSGGAHPRAGYALLALVAGAALRRFARRSQGSWRLWGACRGLPLLLMAGCGGVSLREIEQDDADAQQVDGDGGGELPGSDGGEAGAAGEPCEPELDEELVEHACSHTTLGPHTTVAALSSATSAPPSVSAVQTAFRVDLFEAGARLSYEPAREGVHVLFTDREVSWRVWDAKSSEVAGRAIGVAGCSSIATGYEVTLSAHAPYALEIRDQPPQRFTLFIEHEGTFGKGAVRRDCE
jgi:MYXO-CTERM domain-containing protein